MILGYINQFENGSYNDFLKLPKDSSSLEIVHDSIVHSCMEKMINFDLIDIRRANHIKTAIQILSGFQLGYETEN